MSETVVKFDQMLTPAEVAEITGVSIETLKSWRCRRNRGPAFIKIGSRVFYRAGDVSAWLASQRVETTESQSLATAVSG